MAKENKEHGNSLLNVDAINNVKEFCLLFNYCGNDDGSFNEVDKLRVASMLLFQWFSLLMWKENLGDDDTCVNPCCAPTIIASSLLPEVALTICGVPSWGQHNALDEMVKAGKTLHKISGNGHELPSKEMLKRFVTDMCVEFMKTGISLKKTSDINNMNGNVGQYSRN